MGTTADNAAVCAPRAEVFGTEVPYVRGWIAAGRATARLAEQLVRAGLDDDFGGLKSDVNVRGDGLVSLGPITADTTERLAVLLSRGLCAEIDESMSGFGDTSAA